MPKPPSSPDPPTSSGGAPAPAPRPLPALGGGGGRASAKQAGPRSRVLFPGWVGQGGGQNSMSAGLTPKKQKLVCSLFLDVPTKQVFLLFPLPMLFNLCATRAGANIINYRCVNIVYVTQLSHKENHRCIYFYSIFTHKSQWIYQ